MKDLATDPGPLEEVLREAFGPASGSPVNIQRLSAGATSRIWSFDVPGLVPQGYILRVAAPGSNRVAVTVEAAAMEAARAVNVPLPAVLYSTDSTELFGSPYMLMERVEGETIARHILRDDDYETARKAFAEQSGRILARLRNASLDRVPGLAHEGQLERWEEIFRALDSPVPTFEWAFKYLQGNRPEPSHRATTLVHGDFRLGNMIFGAEGIRAILDWEIVHLGDPLEDLGWLCARPWRFRGPRPVGGMGEYDELLDAYRTECGVDVDREELRWWEVFGTLRWGIICLLQASRHLVGGDRSVELATIGRRVAETELDLLDAIQ